ncbi:hypothetical protein BMETH_248_1 [methanotrophic bacterial endosymbiont of Bathymodiolus sp.]|nr:hypothetical protein BMETH_248_1 [methanotrophic bacterial endosymbiont of Bathymodiolus sp.]
MADPTLKCNSSSHATSRSVLLKKHRARGITQARQLWRRVKLKIGNPP